MGQNGTWAECSILLCFNYVWEYDKVLYSQRIMHFYNFVATTTSCVYSALALISLSAIMLPTYLIY